MKGWGGSISLDGLEVWVIPSQILLFLFVTRKVRALPCGCNLKSMGSVGMVIVCLGSNLEEDFETRLA